MAKKIPQMTDKEIAKAAKDILENTVGKFADEYSAREVFGNGVAPEAAAPNPKLSTDGKKSIKVGDVVALVSFEDIGIELQPDMFSNSDVTLVNINNTKRVHGKATETVPGSSRFKITEWSVRGHIPEEV